MNKPDSSIQIDSEWHVFRFDNGIKLIPAAECPRYRHFPNVHDTGHTVASLSQMPISMYFLDLNGATVRINDEGARVCGFGTPGDSVGKSLVDVSDRQAAIRLIRNSKMVVNAKEIRILEEENQRKDGVRQQFLSIKAPWYGDNNQVVGSCGFSVVLGEHPLAESLTMLSSLGMMNISRHQENRVDPAHKLPVTLTKREHECFELTLKGYTAKRIAQVMGISYRTVEEYLTNIKRKMGVKTKSELMRLALEG